MIWSIQYLTEKKIIYVDVKGKVTVDDLNNMILETRDIAMKNSITKILVDHLESDSELQFMEIFERPQVLENFKMPRFVKMAHVFPDPDTEIYRFFETVLINRGYQVHVFNDV